MRQMGVELYMTCWVQHTPEQVPQRKADKEGVLAIILVLHQQVSILQGEVCLEVGGCRRDVLAGLFHQRSGGQMGW